MKYETSEILNEKNKYGLTMLRMHKKANKGVLSYLILMLIVYHYITIHILFIMVSSMGLIILCNDFIPDYNNYIYFSNWLRYLTPFSIVEKLQLSHYTYIIICIVIYVICLFRYMDIFYLIYQVKHFHITEVYKIRERLIFRILNHVVYIFFSYIIEFLSFIYYIEFLPNDFVIKKDSKISEIINKIICVLNSIFIIIYNINNYFFITFANRPIADKSYPFRMNLPNLKLFILLLLQNFGLFHPLQCYLNENTNRIWCIVYLIVFFIVLLFLYFISFKIFNFDNILNSILSFIGEFCFVSIVIEIILYIISIKYHNPKELILYFIVKLLVTVCLYICLKTTNHKIMMKIINKRLFYNNPYNYPFDLNLITSILFIRELFENKNMKYLSKIQEFLIDHQKQCINFNCACKIIKIKNNINKGDEINFIDDLNKKINYYIESIIINYNYQNNYELSVLLSEHFNIYKKNPIMSYSILQTLIHFNYKNLNKLKLTYIYDLMSKYIIYIFAEKAKNINISKYYGEAKNLIKVIKEMELKQYFNLILKVKKTIKSMINYSTKFIDIIKHKDNYENSTIIKMDEIFNDIKYINSTYLNKALLNKLIDFLNKEIECTSDIKKYLYDLEEYNNILPYEFLYKIFLFVDYFWDGKIPDKLIFIFYAFTTNPNLYSTEINEEIYQLLENRYYENYNQEHTKYFILFKYTKGSKIIYISESLTRKLNYKQKNIINNDIGVFLIKELVEPHNNIMKEFFILQQNNIAKDNYKYIFNSQEYMIDAKINSTLQIGINQNILTIVTIEINPKSNEISFYLNKNLNIISINQNFQKNLCFSLALIKEFKMEIKDLFGIDINDIDKRYKKEIKKVKNIKEYMLLDTKEYILKNLFKHQNQNNKFHIMNKYIIKNDNNDSDKDEEEHILKEKEKNNKFILKTFHNLFNNKNSAKIKMCPIYFKIEKENYLCNLRKIFEKIKSYELDKLESKKLYNDYLILANKYNELVKSKIYFNVKVEPRLVFDTIFYSCKVELYLFENINEINDYTLYELKNIKTEKEEINSINNNNYLVDKKGKFEMNKTKTSMVKFKEEVKINEDYKNNSIKNSHNNESYFRNKIKSNKFSKYSLCTILLFCIFTLLIICIITLNYQTSLVNKNDKIFDTIFYNYYQRTQFIYLHTAILSIFFELVGISHQNALEDNKELLLLIGKNVEKSHQLFLRYYMDFKNELDEDFTQLYEPLIANKITVNWESKLYYNDYNSELALILYRLIDSIKHDFNENDIMDCYNLLLGKFLTIDRRNTPIYGNFVKLVYYFYVNYNTVLREYFLALEDSFDISLNNFSKKTTVVYIILEIIALLSFIFFFIINQFFLIYSNKYIFHNILYLFIDFSQTQEYSFNNKYYNLLAQKKISNYILLLNEFNQKNLDLLKNDKEIDNISILTNMNTKYTIDEDINDSTDVKNNNIKNNYSIKKKNIKKKIKSKKSKLYNKKTNTDESINASISNMNSHNNLLNNSNNNYNNNKSLKMLNEDIHTLNNQELNNISNYSNNVTNSKNNSTKIVLDLYNSNTITNRLTNNNSTLISSNNGERNSLDISSGPQSKIKNENKNSIIFDDLMINQNVSDDFKITIEKIFSLTKITLLSSVKYLIIIFIIFTIIFLVYYICKLVVSLLFISDFKIIISDFKTLTVQYNHVIRYWNQIKTLFILPNTTLYDDLNKTEEFFSDVNKKVNYVYNYRIKKYKKISYLYDYILDTSADKNISSIDFCLQHKRCIDIKYSNTYLLSNGIESTVNFYAKEIFNYYKDYLRLKDTIKNKDDIIKNFMGERYNILGTNINHVVIYLEELYFNYFLNDEKNIVNDFYLEIKLLNIIEVCYCALLNLFSILFVYNYITRIIYSVEESSMRINNSIKRMKDSKI